MLATVQKEAVVTLFKTPSHSSEWETESPNSSDKQSNIQYPIQIESWYVLKS
jgi:hypothetical protein